MTNLAFLGALGVLAACYLAWGIRRLPAEGWQFVAAVPFRKRADGAWHGINLTWYGILSANAYAAAVLLAVVLLGSVSAPALTCLLFVGGLLVCCVPASRLVAWLVERKPATFTVGGAVFVGLLLSPWLALAASRLAWRLFDQEVSPLAFLAACAVSYALGEGLGRLACLSFGCCYGKPLASCGPRLARLLRPVSPVFQGVTKKAVYAADLAGVPLLPMQGLTAIVCTLTALAGAGLYLAGHLLACALLVLTVTQGWRTASEFFRDDFRGGGRFSAYQVMGAVGIVYSWLVLPLLPGASPLVPAIGVGLAGVWAPGTIIFVQLLWLAIFLYTGRSRVTGATLNFHVHTHRA
jgi:prolipoprotein diacylglyceryltransferase